MFNVNSRCVRNVFCKGWFMATPPVYSRRNSKQFHFIFSFTLDIVKVGEKCSWFEVRFNRINENNSDNEAIYLLARKVVSIECRYFIISLCSLQMAWMVPVTLAIDKANVKRTRATKWDFHWHWLSAHSQPQHFHSDCGLIIFSLMFIVESLCRCNKMKYIFFRNFIVFVSHSKHTVSRPLLLLLLLLPTVKWCRRISVVVIE